MQATNTSYMLVNGQFQTRVSSDTGQIPLNPFGGMSDGRQSPSRLSNTDHPPPVVITLMTKLLRPMFVYLL
jgi:hypothetical protein